jgi:hypothetical protein
VSERIKSNRSCNNRDHSQHVAQGNCRTLVGGYGGLLSRNMQPATQSKPLHRHLGTYSSAIRLWKEFRMGLRFPHWNENP